VGCATLSPQGQQNEQAQIEAYTDPLSWNGQITVLMAGQPAKGLFPVEIKKNPPLQMTVMHDTIAPGGMTKFTLYIDGDPTTPGYYKHWTTTGGNAYMQDFGFGNAGTDFWSWGPSVRLHSWSRAQAGDRQTVKVSVHKQEDNEKIGEVEKTIEFTEFGMRFDPDEPIASLYHDEFVKVEFVGNGFSTPWGPQIEYRWYTDPGLTVRINPNDTTDVHDDITTDTNSVMIKAPQVDPYYLGDYWTRVSVDATVIHDDGTRDEVGTIGADIWID